VLSRDQHTAAQAESWALTELLVGEIKEADTIVLGLPLYNFGAPSSVKTWVGYLIAPGLLIDPETHTGLPGGTRLRRARRARPAVVVADYMKAEPHRGDGETSRSRMVPARSTARAGRQLHPHAAGGRARFAAL
jgi:putative NADPH-quinone reductase